MENISITLSYGSISFYEQLQKLTKSLWGRGPHCGIKDLVNLCASNYCVTID
jgi:hypothetical protein